MYMFPGEKKRTQPTVADMYSRADNIRVD